MLLLILTISLAGSIKHSISIYANKATENTLSILRPCRSVSIFFSFIFSGRGGVLSKQAT